MISTELPEGPWKAVGLDFLGPLPTGETVFVCVDYYSRFYEVDVMTKTTTERTIRSLEAIFARHGLPEVIVSDNGPQFRSSEFSEYCQENGINHRKVTPKWAQANGEVERQNKSIMKRLKIAQAEGKDWRKELVRYLGVYRTTPQRTTGKTPAEMLFGRKLRTKLPEISNEIIDDEARDRDKMMKCAQKEYWDKRNHATESMIKEGEKVLVKQDKQNKMTPTFEPKLYDVISKTGNQVTVRDENDNVYKRNVTHVKKFNHCENERTDETDSKKDDTVRETGKGESTEREISERRYPAREHRAPVKLNL